MSLTLDGAGKTAAVSSSAMSRASPIDRASGAAGVANQVPSHAREQVTADCDRHDVRLGRRRGQEIQTTYPGIGPRIAVTVTNGS